MSKMTLLVSEGNHESAPLDDYLHDFALIWQRDTADRSLFDLWFHVVAHCARLVEAVRKERPKLIIDDLADTFVWFLSFIAQTHNTKNAIDALFRIATLPSDLIWNKYPDVCPACLDFQITQRLAVKPGADARAAVNAKRNIIRKELRKQANETQGPQVCECLSRVAFTEERHQIYDSITADLDSFRLYYAQQTRKLGKKRTTLHEFEEMFSTIFRNSYSVLSLQNIAFHLLEEVGEVTDAMKDCYTYDDRREPYDEQTAQHRLQEFEEELADVFSWMCALLLKIRRVYCTEMQKYFQTLIPRSQPLTTILKFDKYIHLPGIIWAKYGTTPSGQRRSTLFCPGCEAAPCECKRRLLIQWSALNSGKKAHQ